MNRRCLVFSVLLAGTLCAQQPGASPEPSATPPPAAPSPSASPSPTPTPPPPPLSAREVINQLSDEDVEKALQALRTDFLDPAKTDAKALQRATLEGLLRRLSPGASVVQADRAGTTATGPTFLAEILDSHIAYLRLGALTADSLAQFDATLSGLDQKKIDAVILDLRGVPSGGDFETAADFARRFCPKGKLLFSIQKPVAKQERIFTSNQDPVFQGLVVVLTDADTAGPAEALAATLRLNAGAMIIGTDTTGEAVEFAEAPLGKDAVLRVAVAQVMLPETGSLFPGGVKPDVAISLPRGVQEVIFRESETKGVSQFVFEEERRRMNEASLVANQNPEIDAAQSAQRDRTRQPALRDTVLQRAVDLITAINFYRAKK